MLDFAVIHSLGRLTACLEGKVAIEQRTVRTIGLFSLFHNNLIHDVRSLCVLEQIHHSSLQQLLEAHGRDLQPGLLDVERAAGSPASGVDEVLQFLQIRFLVGIKGATFL
jgi:hypothetical protein